MCWCSHQLLQIGGMSLLQGLQRRHRVVRTSSDMAAGSVVNNRVLILRRTIDLHPYEAAASGVLLTEKVAAGDERA